MRRIGGALSAVMLLVALAGAVAAQTPGAPAAPAPKEPEAPKRFFQELAFFGYLENSYVFNLAGVVDGPNELRVYDAKSGYTFNMGELSVKKDPSDRYPFGFGLVLTGGEDAQKNHALGLFLDSDDTPSETLKFDIQEAYLSYRLPVGTGLTLKGGKFVSLLGYETIEAPNNLNFSRGFLFGFATPLTNTGLLASYAITDTLSITAGPILGWDVVDFRNGDPSGTGQIAYTPTKAWSTSLNFIVGPEKTAGQKNLRWVLDAIVIYTGITNLTLAANGDYGWEANTAPGGGDATWYGAAAYAAYDWLPRLGTAARLEYFVDQDGVRTGFGSRLPVWAATATVTYKIWKGVAGRVEYRHDQADKDVFKSGTRKDQDTISLVLDYLFF
jgi:hypothetical protein